ncbi:hypothetical protein LINPERPRIM_LOCUS11315 [Linum perenne]
MKKEGGSKFIAPLSLKNSAKRPASFRFSSLSSKRQHVAAKESNVAAKESNVGSSFLEMDAHLDAPTVVADSLVNDDAQSQMPTMLEDDNVEDTVEVIQQELETEKDYAKKKGRGKNKCKAIVKLKAGEKLPINFFQRRGVGKHGDVWVRKLGLIFRDPNIVPVQIKKWKDLSEIQLDHIWASAKEHFHSLDIDEHRANTLIHMKVLWNKWRSKLHTEYVGELSKEEALKNIPPMMQKENWEWCVNEHFFSEEYQKKSKTNKANRNSKKPLPHHRGSRPTRQAIYEHVEEFGEEPDLVTIFNYVYGQDGVVKDPRALEKLDDIKNKKEEMPDASTFELIEEVFGEQKHGNVICLGGGVKAKDFKQKRVKDSALLEKLRKSEEEKAILQNEAQQQKQRIDEVEAQMESMRAQVQALVNAQKE